MPFKLSSIKLICIYAPLFMEFFHKLLSLRGYMEFLPTHMFALLWHFFNSEYVFAVICISIGRCAFLCEQCLRFLFYFLRANAFLLLVLFMLLARSGFTRSVLFFVFHVYGLIRLVWQPFQLRSMRCRSKSAQTLWTGR